MLRARSTFSGVLFCASFLALPACAQLPTAQKDAHSSADIAKPTSAAATPAPHDLTAGDLEAFFDGIVPLQMERSDGAGATVLVMKDGQLLLKKGYGFSDVKNKRPIDPDATMFRLASISKLFTWVSVMQLVERGQLDLDTDINKYLDFQIAPAFGKPITLRNLMTHTGGFEDEIRDIIVTDPKLALSLRDFLMQNQPRRIFPPGEIPGYSNYGVGLAGYIVQRVSGQPFEQYVGQHIFQPLGMTHSSFDEPLKTELSPFVSDGYKNSTEKTALNFEIFNPAPAGGVSSTARDMGRFASALLNGGELDGQRILKTETLAAMWTRQFAASDALPAMCMGFYQTWRNNLHFIGHDGDLIAFHSMFLLEPKEKLAIFISYNSAGSASKSRSEILDGFADRYYPFTAAQQFQTYPVEELRAISGVYQSTRRSESNKLKLGGLADQFHAGVDKDGILTIEVAKDLRGHVRKWKPIGKDLWQVDGDQQELFVIRDGSGKVVRFAGSFGGGQSERVPWYENAIWIGPVFAASVAILLLVVTATLVRLGRNLFFSKRPPLHAQPGTLWLTLGPRLAAFAWLILIITTASFLVPLANENVPPTRSFDKVFVLMNFLTAVAIFFSLFAIGSGLFIWRRPGLRSITRAKFSFVAAACLFLTWFSIHWHILGPAHRF